MSKRAQISQSFPNNPLLTSHFEAEKSTYRFVFHSTRTFHSISGAFWFLTISLCSPSIAPSLFLLNQSHGSSLSYSRPGFAHCAKFTRRASSFWVLIICSTGTTAFYASHGSTADDHCIYSKIFGLKKLKKIKGDHQLWNLNAFLLSLSRLFLPIAFLS